jgi:hypothetical protein
MRLFTTLLTALAALASLAAEPVVWRLDGNPQIGGHATEILGSPAITPEKDRAAFHFNGVSDGFLVSANPLQGAAAFTIEVLFNADADGPAEQRFLHVEDEAGSRALLETRVAHGTWALDTFLFSKATNARLALLDQTRRHPAGQWTWVALVYDGRRMTSYVNGVKELEGEVAFPPMLAGRVSLGVRQNKVYWFKGAIREVRWHTAALQAEALQKR